MSEKPMFAEAKVGDKLWNTRKGWGEVIRIDRDDNLYPLVVRFSKENHTRFTKEGKEYRTDTFPSLFWDEVKITPPPRPKRKVTKVIEGWVNVYKDYTSSPHPSTDVADEYARGDERIACVHVTGTYEVLE